MFNKVLSVTAIATLSNAQTKTYVATFDLGNNGIEGAVTVDNGQVTVDIDLGGLTGDPLPDGYDTCTGGGLSYHIHQSWGYSDPADQLGSDECSGTYTGSHSDPWSACGGASASSYCLPADTDESDGVCIPKADYSPDFPGNYTSAEIGDWSSKYGKLIVTDGRISRTDSSFYEVLPGEMEGLSVVFHCNGGTRAFCAPFIESADDATAVIPDQETTKSVMAVFDALSDDSIVVLSPNGSVYISLDGTDYFDGNTGMFFCDEFEIGIFAAGTEALEGNAVGEGCNDMLGAQYDPTNQCLPWSASIFCDRDGKTEGDLCGDDTYAYDCDWDSDRFSCAPGDLSGKFGTLVGATARDDFYSDKDSLTPATDDLIGMVMAITCPKLDGLSITEPTVFACAEIEEWMDDSSVAQVSFVMACVVSFVALWH